MQGYGRGKVRLSLPVIIFVAAGVLELVGVLAAGVVGAVGMGI